MAQLQNDIVARAVACKLLSDKQVEQCRAALSPQGDAEALVAALVKAGALTPWQVKQLQAAKAGSFFISHYKLLAPLGAGAMGQVFRAADQNVARREVAVKILPRQSATPAAVARFRREGAAALAMQHEHIVRCFELGQHGETHFLVMELVDGATLKEYIGKLGRLSVQETARIGYEVALALEHARQHQIVHRDIKPANILLTRDNRVKVADLGLARFFGPPTDAQAVATRTGMLMGTLDYLAPEQAEDAKRADIRSDLYSLGCTLYHCLAGEAPFASGSEVQRIVAHRERPAPPICERNPEVDNLFADIIEKRLLAKRPEDRFQTPEEAAAALQAWTGDANKTFNVIDLLEQVVQQDATSGTPLSNPADTQHAWDTHREYDRQGQTGSPAVRATGLRAQVERAGRAVGLKSFRDTLLAGAAALLVAATLGYMIRPRSDAAALAHAPDAEPEAPAKEERAGVVASVPAETLAGSGDSSSSSSPQVVPANVPAQSPAPAATPSSPSEPDVTRIGTNVRYGGVDWDVMRCSGDVDENHSQGYGGWQINADGSLEATGGESRWLRSNKEFGDFVLSLEFQLPVATTPSDSGVFLRSLGYGQLPLTGMEIQLADDGKLPAEPPADHRSGGIFGIAGPETSAAFRGTDQWNKLFVRCKGSHVTVRLNDAVTSQVDMNSHVALNVRQRYGHLGISNLGGKAKGAKFRNFHLKELTPFVRPTLTDPGTARFFAIWVKNTANVNCVVQHDLSSEAFKRRDSELRRAGLRPACISGYKGGDGKNLFVGVWITRLGGLVSARHEMTAKEFDEQRADNRRQGYRLNWVDVYGKGANRRFAAIWVNDGQKIEWEDAHGDGATVDEKGKSLEGYQPVIDVVYWGDQGETHNVKVWTKGNPGWWHWYGQYPLLKQKMMECGLGQRPIYIDFFHDPPRPDFVALWRDHGGVTWDFTMSADSAAFQADVDRMMGDGYRLDSINVR